MGSETSVTLQAQLQASPGISADGPQLPAHTGAYTSERSEPARFETFPRAWSRRRSASWFVAVGGVYQHYGCGALPYAVYGAVWISPGSHKKYNADSQHFLSKRGGMNPRSMEAGN
jgi:hypothetical protein